MLPDDAHRGRNADSAHQKDQRPRSIPSDDELAVRALNCDGVVRFQESQGALEGAVPQPGSDSDVVLVWGATNRERVNSVRLRRVRGGQRELDGLASRKAEVCWSFKIESNG